MKIEPEPHLTEQSGQPDNVKKSSRNFAM